MEEIKKLFDSVRQRLTGGALKDAVVSKPLTAGERHVLVLSEVSWGSAPAGTGEAPRRAVGQGHGRGSGG
jgi:uncharacterized spore protein YtfJ